MLLPFVSSQVNRSWNLKTDQHQGKAKENFASIIARNDS
jgi:hypothetical protein